MLMFLVDVVPVNPDTVDEWTHPPFSGYFDGKDAVALLPVKNSRADITQAKTFGAEEVPTTRMV